MKYRKSFTGKKAALRYAAKLKQVENAFTAIEKRSTPELGEYFVILSRSNKLSDLTAKFNTRK